MPNQPTSRFSETAQKILSDSERFALVMAKSLGSEHLLLALASNPGTIAFEILRDYFVTPEKINSATGGLPTQKGGSVLSKDIKNTLKSAFQKAMKYHTPSVDSEHLLLAIASQDQCRAYQALQKMGANPQLIRQQLESFFQNTSDATTEPNTPVEPSDEEAMPGIISAFPPRSSGTKQNLINLFTTDLTLKAKEKKLDVLIGRESELRRISQILVRRLKNNPILTGEAGVGKTAIVEGLAQRIARGEVPRQLADKHILSLDLALLLAGTTYRGQFEERAKRLIDEIVKADNIILFLDEIHTIVGAGAAEGSIDLGHILKPALSRGQLKMIGTTTNEEYRRHIEKDPALERRFQRVVVREPSVEETKEILRGLSPAYEKHHSVRFSPEAIDSAAELAKRYISDRFLPDKAIDLLDEAAAAIQLEPHQMEADNKLQQLEKQRRQANQEHQKAAERFDYEKSAQWRVMEVRLLDEIAKLKSTVPSTSNRATITKEQVAKIVSLMTGIPLNTLSKEERLRLGGLEKKLERYIVGQDEAIKAISSAIRRSFTGISNPKRPLGTFLFLGPTGVGKTELTKVLAREVYGHEDALIKIDMSEFMERHNTSRLVGAPPGYVGFEEAGKLTEQVRRRPYSVILLDEIEKAHPDTFNLLLQIMEDGQLTDAKGQTVSFRHSIVIMTSNIGLGELNRQQAIGYRFDDDLQLETLYEKMRHSVLGQLKDYFQPEFLNRLDEVIVFRPLDKTMIRQIVLLQLEELKGRLNEKGWDLSVDDSAVDFLADKGFDPAFGARPVRRAITQYLETPFSDTIVTQKQLNKKFRVVRSSDKLVLKKV